jgi:hypothetical protein
MFQVQVLTSFKRLRDHCKDPSISEALFQHYAMKGFMFLVNNSLPCAQPLSWRNSSCCLSVIAYSNTCRYLPCLNVVSVCSLRTRLTAVTRGKLNMVMSYASVTFRKL